MFNFGLFSAETDGDGDCLFVPNRLTEVLFLCYPGEIPSGIPSSIPSEDSGNWLDVNQADLCTAWLLTSVSD